MDPITVELPGFKFIGIGHRTNIANGTQDIAKLWGRFLKEDLISRIPEFTDSTIITLYRNYTGIEQPTSMEYEALVGCRVRSLEKVPEGMLGTEVTGGTYAMFLARGQMPQAVKDAWARIDDMHLNRSFAADWDIYGPKSQNGELSEVEIFVALNK